MMRMKQMRTNWKILENYPKYEISEYGEIRHIKNRFGGDAIITYENEIISISTKNS